MARVIIIGAGISGLATAAFLDNVDTLVFEASDAPGGHVRTDRVDGRLIAQQMGGLIQNLQ